MAPGIVTNLWGWTTKQSYLDHQQEQERSLLLDEYQGLFPSGGIEWSGHETDHSPLSSAVVKNESSCTFTPLYDLMRCAGTTYRLKHVEANKRVRTSEASPAPIRRTARRGLIVLC